MAISTAAAQLLAGCSTFSGLNFAVLPPGWAE